MKRMQAFFVLALAGSLAAVGRGRAEEPADAAAQVDVLKREVEALDQKVRILQRQRELDLEGAQAKAAEGPRFTLSPRGFSVSTADTNFVFTLRGLLQVDNRTFFDDGGIRGNDSFLLRKARPIFQGTLYRDFEFLFVPDFGGSTVQIVDANVNYRYRPWLQVRAGKFKVPIGLEALQPDSVTFFGERALPAGLLPNRDIGFQLWGEAGGGVVSYAIGVFNGVGDARSSGNVDFEDHREVAARWFAQPFRNAETRALRGLGFGLGGGWGNVSSNANGLPATTGGTLPGYATADGLQQFFAYNPTDGLSVADGEHWRLSPQGYYYFGPFGVLAEYVISQQRVVRSVAPLGGAHVRNTGWQVAAGLVLTGEDAAYSVGVKPRHPFRPSRGEWGAFQVVGRYAELDIDDDAFSAALPLSNPQTSASAARSWSVGLNWYLNEVVRVSTSYARTEFSGGGGPGGSAPAAVTRQPENVWFTRVQLAF